MADSFDLAHIRSQIKPFRLYWFARLGSTNQYAALLRKRRELFAPAIVLAGKQLSGRGRGSNTWWSAAGSLTATFVLPIQDHLEPQQIPLLAGLVVREVVAELTGEESIQLKWPNDVLYGDRKLAGLLCERIAKADLIGVGINGNIDPDSRPGALRGRITSLQAILGRPVNIGGVIISLATAFSQMFAPEKERPFAGALKEYGRHHVLVGRRITVQPAGEESTVSGICTGLDAFGRLILRSGGRSVRVVAGSVKMERQ